MCNKKICLIIHSLGIGGMERVMALLATHFSERANVQIDLILIGKKRKVAFALPFSISIHRPLFEFDNSRRMFNTMRTIWFLRKKVKEIDPDTILSFGEFWNNLVLLSLYGLSYPVFISDRSQPDKDLGTFQNKLRNMLYPRSAGYVAQTNEAKEICISRGWNDNVRVIGNPIREMGRNDQKEKQNVVLSVGRLIKTKHFDQLIKIFVEIGEPNWKLVIVGGDAKKLNLSNELQAFVKKLGAEDKIYLEGEQKDIDSYYSKSKIFAFTSSSEGFPNVIGEALSAGLPVVAYNCKAGVSDMIKDGKNGFLVSLFDKETFKNRLKELMNNKKKRTEIERNTKKSIQDYNPARVADKFYSFIAGDESDH